MKYNDKYLLLYQTGVDIHQLSQRSTKAPMRWNLRIKSTDANTSDG